MTAVNDSHCQYSLSWDPWKSLWKSHFCQPNQNTCYIHNFLFLMWKSLYWWKVGYWHIRCGPGSGGWWVPTTVKQFPFHMSCCFRLHLWSHKNEPHCAWPFVIILWYSELVPKKRMRRNRLKEDMPTGRDCGHLLASMDAFISNNACKILVFNRYT